MKIPKHNRLITAYGCGVDELGEREDPAYVLPASPSLPWAHSTLSPSATSSKSRRGQNKFPRTLALEKPQFTGKARRATHVPSQGNTGARLCTDPQHQCHRHEGCNRDEWYLGVVLTLSRGKFQPKGFNPDEECLTGSLEDQRHQHLKKQQHRCKWSNPLCPEQSPCWPRRGTLRKNLISKHLVSVFCSNGFSSCKLVLLDQKSSNVGSDMMHYYSGCACPGLL